MSHVSPAGLKIHCVAKDDPERLDPPASTSLVLDLLVSITTLVYVVVEIEPWASHTLGKHCTI